MFHSVSAHVPLLNFIAASNRVVFLFAMSQNVVGVSVLLIYNDILVPGSPMSASSPLLFGLFGLYDGRHRLDVHWLYHRSGVLFMQVSVNIGNG
jgi:hypothetical protein